MMADSGLPAANPAPRQLIPANPVRPAAVPQAAWVPQAASVVPVAWEVRPRRFPVETIGPTPLVLRAPI